jgi:hypothetical protein
MTRPDGIYLNLPEDDYHADQALSASGIKKLLQSPADYWFTSVHNPDRENKDTAATVKGTLYHHAYFEPHKLKELYAIKPDGMSFAKTDGKLWRDQHSDKIIVPEKDFSEVDRARNLAEQSGLFDLIGEGRSEVSIFHTNKSGHRCKCRVDHLSNIAAFDLKSFSNPQRKDVDTCIAHAIYFERYHIAAAWYSMLIEQAKKLPVYDGTTGEQIEKLQTFMQDVSPHEFWLIFQQTGDVPAVYMRELRERDRTTNEINQYWRSAEHSIQLATGLYAQFMQTHGPGKPWLTELQPKEIADHEFAPWMVDNG